MTVTFPRALFFLSSGSGQAQTAELGVILERHWNQVTFSGPPFYSGASPMRFLKGFLESLASFTYHGGVEDR